MKQLSDIESFGAISADEDELLEQCFEDHEAYQAVKNFRRWLVIGRKGAGKTAIYKMILNEKNFDTFSFGHTFRNYPWHHHDRQKKNGVPEHECFSHSWTYLILITLAKILLNRDSSQPCGEFSMEALNSIESFVVDTYGSRDPEISQVFQPQTKLRFKAGLGVNLKFFSGKIDADSVEMTSLPSLIQELNTSMLEKIIGSLNDDMKYFVAFDELDLNFDPNDANYRLRLIGLITSARAINNFARNMGKKLNIVVFLRDDINQFLKFEDKNKITDAAMTRIEWDTPNTRHTLKELMSKRIDLVTGGEGAGWDSIFDEGMLMRGHQSKYQHMLDRTMLRPRDMIKFANVVLSTHKRLSEPENPRLIDNEDINKSREEYSQYLLSELDDEVFRHIPNIEKHYELLRDLDAVTFELGEFEKICDSRRNLFSEEISPPQILGDLFEYSVVGYYQPGGAGYGGGQYIFRYKSPRASFNPRAQSFQVHLGLQEALALKRYRRSSRAPSPVNENTAASADVEQDEDS